VNIARFDKAPTISPKPDNRKKNQPSKPRYKTYVDEDEEIKVPDRQSNIQ